MKKRRGLFYGKILSKKKGKTHPVLVRRKKGENGAEIVQEMDTAKLVEEKRKSSRNSKTFSFESFEEMQANAPKHRSGEYQRLIEQINAVTEPLT